MADRDLQAINSSGELTDIKIGGTAAGDSVAKVSDVPSLGNYTFDDDKLKSGNFVIFEFEQTEGKLNIGGIVSLPQNPAFEILFPLLENEIIELSGNTSAVTKRWVESKITGATGTFTAQSGETVTVTNGLITSIV